ncbi:MAG: hypothetical protein R3B81_13315 [bacterium]
MSLVARVHRKTRDLVRDAAEDLLLADSAPLLAIDRAERWSFDVAGGDSRADVQAILEDTTLVVNPNVHRWRWEEDAEAAPRGTRLEIEVHDRVDALGRSVLRAVRERRGLRSVSAVAHSVVWTIDLEADRAAAESLARRLVGEGERGAGALANPHSQEIRWRVIA